MMITKGCGDPPRRFLRCLMLVLTLWLVSLTQALSASAQFPAPSHPWCSGHSRYFAIRVIDRATGRGIPLVRLQTDNAIRFYTDSNGIVAFYEPGLMHRHVFFSIKSPGYRYPKNGFGFRGISLRIHPGGHTTLRMRRVEIAQRLYRITGAGIYRDSLLVGAAIPIRQPVLNGSVFGSDGAMPTVFKDKIYWFWGDTLEPQYPLGNFAVTGATSMLPGKGGLNPQAGINLHYFLDRHGRPTPMTAIPGPGPTWIAAPTVLPDRHGRFALYATFMKVGKHFDVYRRGLLKFNTYKHQFQTVATFSSAWPLLQHGAPPGGHTFITQRHGQRWIYFANPLPLIRVPALASALASMDDYQAFTCLQPGSNAQHPRFNLGKNGDLRWRWQTNTGSVNPWTFARWNQLGNIPQYIAPIRDVTTGKPVIIHAGCVNWNSYLKRWLLIGESVNALAARIHKKMIDGKPWVCTTGIHLQRIGNKGWMVVNNNGTGSLGDIYAAVGDTPLGPWVYAQRVVNFPRMSFYNPSEDWFFNQHRSRIVFFEATYCNMFSSSRTPTPRYNYNQLMYSLNLADTRLLLPVPLYGAGPANPAVALRTANRLRHARVGRYIAFFALSQARPGWQAIYVASPTIGGARLTRRSPGRHAQPLFYAYPINASHAPKGLVALERLVGPGEKYLYTTNRWLKVPGYRRSGQAFCRVWPAGWFAALPYAVGNPAENH